MTTHKEALTLALEALDQLTNAADTFSVSGVYFNEGVWAKKCLSDAYFAITTIEQALAQPEQEPVAWLVYAKGSRRYFTLTFDVEKVPEIYKGGEAVPLYTTPPQRKPWVSLTDEEKLAANQMWRVMDADGFIKAIEAKLKEKNT